MFARNWDLKGVVTSLDFEGKNFRKNLLEICLALRCRSVRQYRPKFFI